MGNINQIKINQYPPRNANEYSGKIDFNRGLRGYYFFGAIMLLVGILCVISLFIPPLEEGLKLFQAIGAVVFLWIGRKILNSASKRLASRRFAFKNGSIVTGSVTKHERIFVPWKSWRDYGVEVDLLLEGGAHKTVIVQSSDEQLHAKFPVNSAIKILFDKATGAVFIPFETGIDIN